MKIQVPEKFEELLKTDRELRSATDRSISRAEVWLAHSRTPFFPEYTDHGVDHLSNVLRTVESLVAPDAWEVLTASDVSVLILSVLLHDSAMHLSEEGFCSFITGEASGWSIPEFDTAQWSELWESFLFAAKRWDDRKQGDVLGVGERAREISDPLARYPNLSEADRRLIGEFIRTHHPRMAHEFGYFGIPGSDDKAVSLSDLDIHFRDLAGLVARSHGLSIRSCVDHIAERFHGREFRGVHAAFLMALLRVADYLQIEPERAPGFALRLKGASSPLSRIEWEAHAAVSNITRAHDDPESIEIQAEPRSVQVFLRLKEWLSGIQAELDASWAVLGELYGRHNRLKDLGLTLRRVRSNLDDAREFARTVNYEPDRVEFDVARPDLLRLLIRPLYGDQPSIGVRELIQNSVDAVRELEATVRDNPDLGEIATIEQEGDVEVWLDAPDVSGWSWLTVSDRGIGMDTSVVRDFFLCAGKSFRDSEAWQRQFERETEGSGDSDLYKVARSGRFGVGALAAFLIGPEIRVSTRKVGASAGLRFLTRLELEPIELRYDPDLRVGTTIRIHVPPETAEKLRASYETRSIPDYWSWFREPTPTVRRMVGPERKELKQEHAIPRPEDGLSSWRDLPAVTSYRVRWSFAPAPALTCNGIFVTNSRLRTKFHTKPFTDPYFELVHPNIAITDRNCSLPLNLTRNGLTERAYDWEDALAEDIIRDFLAFLLVRTADERAGGFATLMGDPERDTQGRISHRTPQRTGWEYQGFARRSRAPGADYGAVFLTPEGLCAIDPGLLALMSPTCIWIVSPASPLKQLLSHARTPDIYLMKPHETKLDDVLTFLTSTDIAIGQSKKRAVRGIRAAMCEDAAMQVLHSKPWGKEYIEEHKRESYGMNREEAKQLLERFRDTFTLERSGSWTGIVSGTCDSSRFPRDLSIGGSEHATAGDFATFELFVERLDSDRTCEIGRQWREIIGDTVIPFDLSRRREELAGSYQLLERSIEIHELLARRSTTCH